MCNAHNTAHNNTMKLQNDWAESFSEFSVDLFEDLFDSVRPNLDVKKQNKTIIINKFKKQCTTFEINSNWSESVKVGLVSVLELLGLHCVKKS